MPDGNFDEIKGKAKEGLGKVTGDESTEADGIKDQVVGRVKDAAEQAKDTAKEKAGEAINRIKGAGGGST